MLLGLAVGLAGLFIRKHLPEETHKPDPAQAPPIVTAFREHWRDMFRVAGVMLMGSVGFYLIFVFLTTYLSQTVKVPIAQALEINTFSMIVLMLLIPFYGHLADKIGPARIVVTSAFACLILAWPLFWLLHHQNPWIDLIGQLGFVMVIAPYQGAYPALVVQMLPKNARCTVLSVGFNLCVGLIGGTTPMVASYLIKKTHDDLAPAWFLMIASFITWITVYMWQLKLRKDRISTMKTSS
jgi:MHS family proline/betaine transporter-like MFS transporter